MANKEHLAELLTKANFAINWDNWEKEDEDGERDGHYKLGDVYYCKLDWIRESLDPGLDSYDEYVGIIEDLQNTIVPILNALDQD